MSNQEVISMEKAKFTIEGYELKQLKMNNDGSVMVSFDTWKNKKIAMILLEKPDLN